MKITAIGSIWAIVTMPVWVEALTMLPMSTWRKPATPEIGALMVGIVELGLRVGDGGVVSRDLGGQLRDAGALGIGLLAGREFAELDEALQVEIGVGEIGLVLRLLGFGLIERRLVGPGIDLGQQVTLLDQLAFLEGDLVDLAVDAGSNQHGVEGLNRSETGQIDREIRLLDRRDLDRHGLPGPAPFCALLAAAS